MMPDSGNWTDVVHYPLGFAAFILFLVYRLVKSRKADNAYPRVFLGLAVLALLSALVLAFLQTPPTAAPSAVEQSPDGEAAGVAGANGLVDIDFNVAVHAGNSRVALGFLDNHLARPLTFTAGWQLVVRRVSAQTDQEGK